MIQNLSLGASSDKKPIQRTARNRLCRIENVHKDDIHGFIRLSDGTFVSGSKDGSLKQWKFSKPNVTYKDIKTSHFDYTNWITALAPLNDTFWLSGTRNGSITCWDMKGGYRDLNIQRGLGNSLCKERNTYRVNCLASFPFGNDSQTPQFLAGWPTRFTLHTTEQELGCTSTSLNDWVYAIQPINLSSLLVVTGCRLDRYVRTNGSQLWEKEAGFIKENRRTDGVRPYISAITPLQSSPSQYGLAVFDGSVRVYDIEAKRELFRGEEHKNRVWTIENINSDCFASCGDDGYIKLWDVRKPGSLFSIEDNEKEKSRVSILKLLKENELLSGSCPDQVRQSQDKAQFSIWDIRKI